MADPESLSHFGFQNIRPTSDCPLRTFDETKDFLNLSKSLADKIQSTSPVYSQRSAIASLEKDKFSKGSTSTFLGIQFRDKNTFDVVKKVLIL